MNETNLIPRQRFILNLINQSNGLSRGKIQEELGQSYQISKPTLIRDLKNLVGKDLIRIEGKGKNTRYFSYSKKPLLKFFDVDGYFSDEPDQRTGVKEKFDFSVFKYLNGLFSSLDFNKVNRVKKSFAGQTQKLDPGILRKELERFVIELSWKSSKIEGNTYTLLQTEALIKERKEADGKKKEEALMILNHKEAFDEILKDKQRFKKLTLTQINQLHNILVKGLEVKSGIRKQAVGITGTVYQPLDNEFQIREAMERLIKVIADTEDALEKALIANAMISYIQPYADGNKRTGRMLANALLLAGDYYPLSYRSVDEQEFKKALILFYEQHSIHYLKKLFIEQLVFAYKTYFK